MRGSSWGITFGRSEGEKFGLALNMEYVFLENCVIFTTGYGFAKAFVVSKLSEVDPLRQFCRLSM